MMGPTTTVDRATSERVGRAVRARPKRCYANAARALLGGLPELEGAVYCEGLAGSVMIKHAWLETADGRVIDPTSPGAFEEYWPAARYTADELRRAVLEQGFYGVIGPLAFLKLREELCRAEGTPAAVEMADGTRAQVLGIEAKLGVGWTWRQVAGEWCVTPPGWKPGSRRRPQAGGR